LKKKITLKDISIALGVSISTVSKSLKDSEEIGKETREKVKQYAKKHHYQPNQIALSLKNNRSNHIGVIIPDIIHHFFTNVVKGVYRYATSMGYNVSVYFSDESYETEVQNVDQLLKSSADGIIVSLASETQLYNKLDHFKTVEALGVPLVLFDRLSDEIDCDKISFEDRKSAYQATQHFIHKGRSKIALITTETHLSIGMEREMGYREALKDNGFEIDERLILHLSSQIVPDSTLADFFNDNDIDAVLCLNEILAVQSMRVVDNLSNKKENKILFIGFTDGFLAMYSNPPLTTVDQHGQEMGEKAAKLLINRIESESRDVPFKHEVIRGTLIERDSTRI
jgi:LacI family transcriptional regulator